MSRVDTEGGESFCSFPELFQDKLIPIDTRTKNRWYKSKTVKKFALDSQLLTVQILTNDVQVLISCPSYFITTVPYDRYGHIQ